MLILAGEGRLHDFDQGQGKHWRKWLKGKETKVPVDGFLQDAVCLYLERLSRLEDPRN